MSESIKCLHAIVHGRVQGVNFRYHTQMQAQALGLNGWVANRADGTVEVLAEGPRAALDQLLAFLRVGPSQAHVERVDVDWPKPTGRFTRFQVTA
jgi:acylphosphatase